jgi:hypothetical protein
MNERWWMLCETKPNACLSVQNKLAVTPKMMWLSDAGRGQQKVATLISEQ